MTSIRVRKRAPAHVPPELIYNFDLYADPAPLGGPHAMHLALNDDAPDLFYTLKDGGHWIGKARSQNWNSAFCWSFAASAL